METGKTSKQLYFFASAETFNENQALVMGFKDYEKLW